MVREVLSWNSFNAGELSKLMDGRVDQEKYTSGCRKLLNFIPTVQGPAVRRGGTRYLGKVKDQTARTWLHKFEYNATQSYVLELGNNYMRFWANRGQLLSGGTPFELATPWATADLVTVENTKAFRSVQQADVMWALHVNGTVPPQKLQRFGATNWTLTPVPFTYGPFKDVDPSNKTVLVSASATTGNISLYSSAPVFTAADVGTSFYMEVNDPASVPTWAPGVAVTVGTVWRYQGNVYRAVSISGGPSSGGYTGPSPPVHTRGQASDGSATAAPGGYNTGAVWQYIHSGYGFVTITALISSTQVSATVLPPSYGNLAELPSQLVSAGGVGTTASGAASNATTRWAHALFNSTDGWPTALAMFRNRLCYARGARVVCSQVGDYDNFALQDGPSVTAITAINVQIGLDKIDNIRWLSAASDLLLGASRCEASISEQSLQMVFSASNLKVTPQTEYGSRLLAPLHVGEGTLYIQRAGKKLREMKYRFDINKYGAEDLTVLADHMLRHQAVDMDFAAEPDMLLWMALADGSLKALTYNRERGVVGWAQHTLGGNGLVEAVSVIAAPDATRDDPWFIVNRTINGAVTRYIEYAEDPRLVQNDVTDGFYVDAGLTYSGAPVSSVSGFSHLEGQTVSVFADGAPQADAVVTGGVVALQQPASKVQCGLGFSSILIPMRPDAGAQGGAGQSRKRSLGEMAVRFTDTLGGSAGPNEAQLDVIPYLPSDYVVGTTLPMFSGDKFVTPEAVTDTDGFVCVAQTQPLPMTLIAIYPRMDTND